jgi:hypothetical protein
VCPLVGDDGGWLIKRARIPLTGWAFGWRAPTASSSQFAVRKLRMSAALSDETRERDELRYSLPECVVIPSRAARPEMSIALT